VRPGVVGIQTNILFQACNRLLVPVFLPVHFGKQSNRFRRVLIQFEQMRARISRIDVVLPGKQPPRLPDQILILKGAADHRVPSPHYAARPGSSSADG
jgi:hypothetical protein